MDKKRNTMSLLVMALSILGAGLASVVMTRWLLEARGGFGYLSFTLGTLFGGVGWLLAENIGDAAFLLLGTGAVGAVVLTHLQSELWRIVVIAFLCGFNMGKIGGGIYREYGT
jgi:hypothetical protein